MTPTPALSIVIPVYNGAATVGELVAALAGLSVDGGLEIILVDDGSRDDSATVCEGLVRDISAVPVTLALLSRNFGEHNAVLAGLRLSQGAHVITMDDDLQNPPSEVLKLLAHAHNADLDTVYGAYVEKQHSLFRNLGSAFANWTARRLLDVPPNTYLSSFRCLSRFVVDQITRYDGPFPYVDGLILQVTQKVGSVAVRHVRRDAGHSNYTIRRLVRLWMNICFNFSSLPLRLSALIGAGACLCSLVMLATVLAEYFLYGVPVAGWTSLMATILLFTGAQMLMLGLLGEYVGRIFLTLNRRPQQVVRSITRPPAP